MANSKRRQQAAARASTSRMAAKQPRPVNPPMQASSAGTPTIVVANARPPASETVTPPATSAAERAAQSLSGERAAIRNRRVGLLAGIGALLVLASALVLYFRPSGAAQPAVQATAAPAAQAQAAAPAATVVLQPTAAPVAQATVVPAAQAPVSETDVAQPTAAPAAQPTAAPAVQPTVAPVASQAGGQPASAGITCSPIAGLPAPTSAVCVEQDTDQDDGLLKIENTYETSTVSNEIRGFYESAFAQNGWVLQEFRYDIALGLRQLNIVAESEQGPSGIFTKLRLTEDGASTGVANTCNAIAGLPAYPNATCVEFDLDNDDGVIKTENTYTVAATPDEVRNFYANALVQNSWAPQEFSYDITQGLRRIQISAEAQPGLNGAFTRIKVAEQ